MRAQCARRFVPCRPPSEAALRQSLRREPKSLAVIGQQFYSCAPAAAEDEQTAGKGIGVEFLTAQLRQRIDPFPAVDPVYRYQDTQLRRDLNQDADSHSSRLSAARYEAEASFNWIRSFAWRPSSPITHSVNDSPRGPTSSTNLGGSGLADAREAAAMRRFR